MQVREERMFFVSPSYIVSGFDLNADNANFVASYAPWFMRGARNEFGLSAGVFAFNNANGHINGIISFRVGSSTIWKTGQKETF